MTLIKKKIKFLAYGLAILAFICYWKFLSSAISSTSIPGTPETLLSPDSAYYGMQHIDKYGLPLSWFTNKTIESKYEDWTQYFSTLFKSFKKYESQNPNKNQDRFTTSASVVISKQNYKVGETFKATLQARDSRGELKKFGGDYFRARLIRDKTKFPDGIPCRVIDNTDGTYTIEAPLPMQGRLILDIKLVLSVEGAYELNAQQTSLGSWGHVYVGTYESGESLVCNVNLDTDKTLRPFPKCDFTNPRNKEPWLCLMPLSKRCTPLKNIAYQGPGRGMTLDIVSHCKLYQCQLSINTNVTVTVSSNDNNQDLRASMQKCNQMCSENLSPDQITGYFENSSWKSFQCNNLEKISNVNNKVVYFLGDSTIRQFYYWFQEKFVLKDSGPDSSHVWQQPRISKPFLFNRKNLTLYYRAHGPPLQNPGPPSSRPYISDTIVNIPIGGEDVVVVFNIGAHLLNYDPSVFLHRIKGINDAIAKHHKKFPETRFIVRSQNVVEYIWEWNIYRFEIMFRKTFSGLKNVVYLSVWDITTVWPLGGYHPTLETLDQQAMLMLSYIV